MSENYPDARHWHRLHRRMECSDASLRSHNHRELEQFYREVDGHLSGSFIKSEIQACGLRLFVLYREIQSQLNRKDSLESFASVLGEGAPPVYNWLRGSTGIKRYTIDILHSWCVLLTKHWKPEGVVLYLLCHPTGIIEPMVYVKPTE